jgi:predicted RNA-binding protein
MCELKVYVTKGKERVKVMEGVVRLMATGEKVILEGIFGERTEVSGRLSEVNITAQEALISGS